MIFEKTKSLKNLKKLSKISKNAPAKKNSKKLLDSSKNLSDNSKNIDLRKLKSPQILNPPTSLFLWSLLWTAAYTFTNPKVLKLIIPKFSIFNKYLILPNELCSCSTFKIPISFINFTNCSNSLQDYISLNHVLSMIKTITKSN